MRWIKKLQIFRIILTHALNLVPLPIADWGSLLDIILKSHQFLVNGVQHERPKRTSRPYLGAPGISFII